MTIQPIRKGIKKFNMTIFLCWNFHTSYLNKMIYIGKGCIFSTHLFGHPSSAEHICLSHKHVRNSTFFFSLLSMHSNGHYQMDHLFAYGSGRYIFKQVRLFAFNWNIYIRRSPFDCMKLDRWEFPIKWLLFIFIEL